MNTTQTHTTTPALPLLRRASTLIAMGTVGLALVAVAPANAEDAKPKPKTATTTTTPTQPLLDGALPLPAGNPAYRARHTFEPRFSEGSSGPL